MNPTAHQLQQLATIAGLGTTPPPSLREVAVALDVGVSAVAKLVGRLGDLELVTTGRGRRTLRITPAGRAVLAEAEAAAPELPDAGHRQWRNRYLFAHTRDAVRSWAAQRDGKRADRARGGSGGGRTPALEDVARVGRVLQGLATGPQLGVLVAWSRGGVSITDQRVKALVDRVTLRLQSLRIVASPVHALTHRSTWRDADGQERVTIGLLVPPKKGLAR